MVKLGIMLEGQENVTWERWHRIVDAAESLGFDSLWRSDHLFSVMGEYYRETLALWPSLTTAVTRTSRIEIGQLVSPTTFRNPIHLIYNAVALDQLSGGRFWLGVGAGWNEAEHAAFGFALPPLKERMDRFEEALEVIELLQSGETVSFDGRYFPLKDARMASRPTRASGVPLILGGSGEKRTLRQVAEHADEWNITTTDPENYRHKLSVLEQHCADIGRDPASIQKSYMCGHIIGRDDAEVRERASRLKAILPPMRELTDDEVIERTRTRGYLVGTVDEVVAQIQARGALGVQRIMLQTFDTDDIGALELFASDVIPRI
jgi:F420-dependent oxidoreductase-like protein